MGGGTIEPADGLHAELIREYELKIEAAVRASHSALAVMHTAIDSNSDDIDRMISELMLKHKVEGSVADWRPGVEEEFKTVSEIRFEEVDQETADRVLREGRAMKLRMILELKKDNRRKGRLVAQGFWEDVFTTGAHVDSPVASFASVRTLLFKTGQPGEVIASGDISKAFLMADEYPDSDEPRYCYFSMYKGGPKMVWRLKGPLYGSRDSPKLWFESIRRFMLTVQWMGEKGFVLDDAVKGLGEPVGGVDNGFEQGLNEPCVFTHPVTGLIVVLFVDDIITRGMPEVTTQFYETLNETYALRSWSILTPENPLVHLGFSVTEEFRDGKVFRYLDQEADVKRFIRDNELEFSRRVSSPMPDKRHIVRSPKCLDAEEAKWFKSLVGQMGWYAISLRWDIAHSVSRLQQFSASPTRGALDAAIRVAGYLANTANFRLGGEVRYGENHVQYYTDSDHAGDRELGTKSHSGFMVLLNTVPVHWRSKKQPKTVLSPANAEIYALSEGLREARSFQWMCSEMGIELSYPINIQMDNS